ncbi:acyltransferase family protein [Bosea sp. (in: a-proteobacteria)]|uniref:acyltransferase family protein n=1 Tax=Bosea sp. (in: a-proteobacteria) TaxID=1871050 RepID=UPI003568664C
MKSRNIEYIDRIDHLRFFAAFIVLMYHAKIFYSEINIIRMPMLDQGYIGVSLFMVLSGMILTMITYGKDISIKGFYINRALRIYPLFVFVVTLGYFSTPDPRNSSVGIDYLLSLLPVSNLYRMTYGPFGGQLWSVMVEIQFYLLFPVLALALKARGPRFHCTLILLLITMRAAVFVLNGAVYHMAYFSIFGNLDIFLIGCLAGIAYKATEGRTFAWYWPVLIIVAMNILLVVLYRFLRLSDASPLWIIWPDLQGVIWAALIITYLRADMRIPLSSALSYLGKISYSIYAWHILVWMLVARVMPLPLGTPYLTGLVLVLPLTIALSAVSYAVIESPFLMMRARYVSPSAGAEEPARG